jgi:hypothetical protein
MYCFAVRDRRDTDCWMIRTFVLLFRCAGRAAGQRCQRGPRQGQQLPSARNTTAGGTPTGAPQAEDWRQQQQDQAKHARRRSCRRGSSSRARTVSWLVLQLQV